LKTILKPIAVILLSLISFIDNLKQHWLERF